MRCAVPLLLVLLLPTAGAWSIEVEAPREAPAGLPFDARVCVSGAPGRVEVRAWLENGTLSSGGARLRPDRYALALDVADGRACAPLSAQPGMDARTTLRARLRSGATAAAEVALDDAPLPTRVALVDAWGPPFSGVRLRNDGAEVALDALALEVAGRRVALPDATLAPGATLFVGKAAPPGETLAAADLGLRAGEARLMIGTRPLSTLAVPTLAPGMVADGDGLRRAGVSRVPAQPMRVEGALLVYATPDAGAAPVVDLLESARREVLLEGYTFTSPDVAAALARALDRGVVVRILLEGAPAGGIEDEERAILSTLAGRGADVALLRSAAGFPARFAAVHAKVIVVDREAALVATENLHASSYPAAPAVVGTRGYGVVVRNATLARALADVLDADMAPWPDVQRVDLDALPPPAPALASARSGPGDALLIERHAGNATLVLSPDDPLALARAIDGASRSVDVALLFAQPRFGADENPLLESLVAAARRNVSVRLLLDGRVDDGRNREVAARLAAIARRDALPLEARVDRADRLLHAKMVVLDAERAYVGSMNWGRASANENREAGLLLDSPEAAAWLALRFEEDWSEEKDAPPARREVGSGLAPAVVGLALSCRLLRALRGPCQGARGP